jgi:tripartite-type tricarboxylate transporter receptor subunit TctC
VFGTAYAAKMPPDGYTVAVGTNSTFVVNTFLYKKLPYDPVRDFRPLTQLHINYFAIIVAADVKAKTLADFIALAKSKPGELNAAAGTANVTLADALFEMKAGVDMEVVNYKSVVAALQDMAAGRVQVAVTDVSSSLPYLDSKQVRALAVAGPHRSPALPDVPDTEEAGLPGFIVSAWTGFFMPKGTPDAIVDRMSTELRAVLHDPEIEQIVHTGGGQIVASSPAEFGAFLQTDLTNMAGAAKAAKIEPQ